MKKATKRVGGFFFYYGGIFSLIRFLNNIFGKRLTIVTYHRITHRDILGIESSLPFLFTTLKSFNKHLLFFLKKYKIISFNELAEYHENDKIPWNSLIITFDDGYEDNYYAYELLKKMNIPATFFLVTDKIGKDENKPLWWDRLYYFFNFFKMQSEKLKIEEISNNELITLFQKYRNNISELFQLFNNLPTEHIEEILDNFQSLYKIDNNNLIRNNRFLSWNQILEMSDYINFGSHSCKHQNLTIIDEDIVKNEIIESKKIIEKKTNKEVIAFSYPAGKTNNKVKEIVKNAGYLFAVTTNRGVNKLKDRYSLKRINIWEETGLSLNGKFSKGIFAYKLLGF